MVEINNLTKIYKTGKNEIRAIDDISFNIAKGDFITITGRSGSGKSTLLYQLGLLDKPTSGRIKIGNDEVANLTNEERSRYRLKNLGYIFQNYELIPTLTATENVLLPLIMMDINEIKAKEIAYKALSEVGLKERTQNLPNQLSGGEQQRVAIARAIANEPDLLFADEPTANLDTETAKTILNLLIELNKKGLTIVMVTHELEYAKLGKRTLTLSDGKLIKQKDL